MSHVAPHSEPLVRLSKRDVMPAWQGILVRIIGVLLGVALSSLFIVLVTDLNPAEVFTSLFDGCFGSPRRIWNLFQNTAILLCIALAVTPAYKMKFWNIGAEGQVLMGAAATAACHAIAEITYRRAGSRNWTSAIIMFCNSIAAADRFEFIFGDFAIGLCEISLAQFNVDFFCKGDDIRHCIFPIDRECLHFFLKYFIFGYEFKKFLQIFRHTYVSLLLVFSINVAPQASPYDDINNRYRHRHPNSTGTANGHS